MLRYAPHSRPARIEGHTLAHCALALFVCVLFWPLCLGKTLYWGDILLYFLPMYRFEQVTLQSGSIPLWNPHILLGQPFIGNPQMGVFYPATLLLGFVPVWLYLSLVIILHVFLCGVFTYLYLGRRGYTRTASLAGSFVFMGSAFVVGRAQFPPMLQTAAFLPLLLYLVDRCVDEDRRRGLAALALCIALTILAAHAQMAYLALACSLCYTLFRLYAIRMAPKRLANVVLRLCVSSGLGILLTLVQTLPAVQLLVESPREHLTAFQANRFVFELSHLLTLVAPRFFGHPATADYWGRGNAWEPALFVGWVPLLLVGVALSGRRWSRAVKFWCVAGIFCAWLALGTEGGLFWLAYALVPGVSNFHDPARFLFITTFALAFLTAHGLDAFRTRYPITTPRMLACTLLGIAMPLLWYGQDWNPAISPLELDRLTRRTTNELAKIMASDRSDARVYLPVEELFWQRFINDGYVDYGRDDPSIRSAMAQSLLPNLTQFTSVSSASGYEPVPLSAVGAIDGLASRAVRRGEPTLGRLSMLLDASVVLTPASQVLHDPTFRDTRSRGMVTAGRSRQTQRSGWLVHHVRLVRGKLRTSAALASPAFEPGTEAIYSDPLRLPHLLTAQNTARNFDDKVVAVQRTATEIRYTVSTSAMQAFLVTADVAYPGWTATIDGWQSDVIRCDGALMGVVVPRGSHAVCFRYAPFVFRFALYLSLCATAAFIAGCVSVKIGVVPSERRNYRSDG